MIKGEQGLSGNRAFMGTVAVVLAVAACSTAALSEQGARVVTSQSAPIDSGFDPKTCKHLGFVVGKGGGTFGGAWIANENLVDYAMNDLRNKAAAMGANFVQHDTPQMGVGGGKDSTSTTTATVSGNAYACDGQRSDVVAVTPSPKPEPQAAKPLPEGVAGFRLRATLEQSKKICEDAGHQFTQGNATAKCSSSVVDLKAPSQVQLSFCGTQVCGIAVTLLPPAENLAKYMDSLSKQLTARYGTMTANKTELKHCPQMAELAQCIMQNTARVLHEWSWPSKHAVSLGSGRDNDKAYVVLTYVTPDYANTHAPGPAL